MTKSRFTVEMQYAKARREIASSVAMSQVWSALSETEKNVEIALTQLIGDMRIENHMRDYPRDKHRIKSTIVGITMIRLWGDLSPDEQNRLIESNFAADLPQYRKLENQPHFAKLKMK